MQNLSYSKIIRLYREKASLTLRELSELTFFGFQTLSKYEIDLIPLSDENLEVIAKFINIDVNQVYYINSKLSDDLNHLYECIVYDYSEDIDETRKRILKAKEYIPYCDLYHYFLVMMFALDIIEGKESSNYLDIILNSKEKIDSNYIQIFNDYYAIYMNRNGQLKEGIDCINRALSLGKRSLVSGMLHYHAGLLYSLRGNLKISLEHNLEAEHLFIQEHNHIRLISVQTNIATIYARQNDLHKALEIYYRLLKEALRSKNSDIEIVTRYNIAWCYRKMDQFSQSNDVIAEIELKSPLSINGFYIKASNYIDLSKKSLATEIIEKCLINNLDPLFKLKFELLDYKNKMLFNEEYSSKLKQFLNISRLSFDYENTEFALNKLIEYYEMKFVYKTANSFLKEKIVLIENKFSN